MAKDEIVTVGKGTQQRAAPTIVAGTDPDDTIRTGLEGDAEIDLEKPAGEGEEGDGGETGAVVINDKDQQRLGAGEGEEGDGEGEDPPADRKPRKPYRKTRDGRINTITREKQEAVSEAERLKAENEELKRQKAESDFAAVVNYGDKLKLDQRQLQADLKRAIEEGDTDKQAELTTQQAELAAEITRVEGWKKSNKPPVADDGQRQPQQQQQQRPQQQQRQPRFDDNTQAWIDSTDWFNPKSQGYEPEIAQEATAFAQILERRLHRQGKANLIGSDEYFQEIEQHVAQEFPDYFEDAGEGDGIDDDPPPRQAPPARRPVGSRVAPATRTAVPGQRPAAGSPNQIRLSQEQREFARGLFLSHPDGRPYSAAEKEKAYALQLRNGKR